MTQQFIGACDAYASPLAQIYVPMACKASFAFSSMNGWTTHYPAHMRKGKVRRFVRLSLYSRQENISTCYSTPMTFEHARNIQINPIWA